MSRPIVLMVGTEERYFLTHRLAQAKALQQAGYRVVIATRFEDHARAMQDLGLELAPVPIRRQARGAWSEVQTIFALARWMRTLRPAAIHLIALKPVVYGGIASLLAPATTSVNAITGLGIGFQQARGRFAVVRPVLMQALRLLLGRARAFVIVQNPEDGDVLEQSRIGSANRRVLIRGSGVDTHRFRPAPLPEVPCVMFAARMLRSKGVLRFIAAARSLKAEGVPGRFVLVGEPDATNPDTVSSAEIEPHVEAGIVEWRGHVDDMPGVLAQSSIVCLPTTYGEGVPKVLIEAAACGRAIVASDWPGCREIVRDRTTGLLVPPDNHTALVDALRALLQDPARVESMGAAARDLVLAEFSDQVVTQALVSLYRRVAPISSSGG